MEILVVIFGGIFVLMVMDQYVKDEEERERKKKEAEERQRLELIRQQELQAKQDRIIMDLYQQKLRQQVISSGQGLNRDQIVLWSLIIILASCLVFTVVWFI